MRRLAFVAPEICVGGDSCPDQEIANHPEALVFNLNAGNSGLLAYGPVLRLKNFVTRAYGLSPSDGNWPAAIANGINVPSTDQVNAAPPTTMITANPQGWPFTCLQEDCTGRPGDQPTLGVRVISGDIWGHSDDFAFAEAGLTPTQIEARLFVPGSSVNEWAKACIMARAALTSGSAYFALCRSADNHAPFIQFRTTDSGDTSQSEINPSIFLPAIDVNNESITALRLSASNDGKCFIGEASPDGVQWQTVGSACFATPLMHRGVAASSHGSAAVSFDYVGLKLDGVVATTAAFKSMTQIGKVQAATLADAPL